MKKERTELPGNSNALIEFELDCQYGHVVKKTCFGGSASRLLRQASKQQKFSCTASLRTPQIYQTTTDNNCAQIVMEFVRGHDFVLFTNSASADEFEVAINSLISLVKREFEQSRLENFPFDVWNTKVQQVTDHCRDKELFDSFQIDDILLSLKDMPKSILVGECHGDFTFSNVIVEKPDRLFIFDFLDPPFETPYEDAAKFLQDAQFHWSLLKHTGKFDKTRVKIYWHRAEKMLRDQLSDFCNFEVLRKFQILGLLRILPYTSDKNVIHFLKENILQEVKLDLSATVWRGIV